MRVLIFLLMIFVATALSLGAGLLVGFQLRDASDGLLIAAAATSPFLVMGPVVIGVFAGSWDHRSSRESRRFLGWWFSAVVAIDVVAVVIVVLAALSAQAPLWVPVVLAVGTAVLLASARPLGALFRRTEAPIPETPGTSITDAGVVRRKVRPIAVTFVVAALVTSIGAALLIVLDGDHGSGVMETVLLAGQLTFTATAMTAAVVSLPYSRALRDAAGRDIGRVQRFGKVVLGGKALPLDDAEQRGAVEYARLAPIALQFQLVFLGLLYVGIAFQFVSSAIRGEFGVLPAVTLTAMVVVLLVTVPLTVRRIRRARTYADEHRTDAVAPSAVGTSTGPTSSR
ncbi:hypothetical protein DEJ16_02835 [Curtobacterium sp. MCJR17_055]|uniref:hypothetical protein n=2 Tax=Curtobacterium TaxID=2034 RepID=UPI000D87382F|nr:MULTISPECIES: hypothetical protein [unclassified Curtobacterium]PYY36714.1 hypothetical protein DEI87_03310 [Curtobacterium sp. MCBD17_029]PYY58626.1 hypothetical protein DEJ16_02835 [Curtobacterium sp. MCJR17_055]PYY59833.1 hypothetical protein DEJ26_08075 [Curtobacterium sp. MCPF17_015]